MTTRPHGRTAGNTNGPGRSRDRARRIRGTLTPREPRGWPYCPPNIQSMPADASMLLGVHVAFAPSSSFDA